jgi:cytoskeleton protein RodZ
MTVGAELRAARLRAGLSQQDISQRTTIQLEKVEALEADHFERLPDGIYLDGLIRAFAQEVGLDGRELVNRLRREDIAPQPAVEDVPMAPIILDATDLADEEFPSESDDTIAVAPPVPAADIRYTAAPLPAVETSEPRAPSLAPPSGSPRATRWALPLIAVLAAIALGAYLYSRNRPFVEREDIATPTVSEDTAAALGTQPSAAPGAAGVPSVPPATANPSVPGPEARGARPSGATPSRDTAAPEGASPRNASASAREESQGERPTALDRDESSRSGRESTASLSGFWSLDTRAENSSPTAGAGQQVGYRVELQQEGRRIKGHGVKTSENGQAIDDAAQTPITMEGSFDGKRLMLWFIERGAERYGDGKLILDVHENGVLRGRFSSNGAQSNGTAEARRPEG